MRNIAIIGDGGHSKVIKDIINASDKYQIFAVFDDKYERLTKEKIYFGPISSVQILLQKEDFQLVVAIGNNQVRKGIVESLQLDKSYYGRLIHPSAVISNSACVGYGTVIMPNTVINSDTKIGNHTIINTAAVVEHDNNIDDFVHISPNATLTGTVVVKKGTHIGAGTTLIPGVTIGEWSVIGAGSTVIDDIPSRCTAVGTPARIIKGGNK